MNHKQSFKQMFSRSSYWIYSLLGLLLSTVARSEVIQLTSQNINNILATHELVLVNFYADWCRFSQILAPVFEETAKKLKEEFPAPGKLAFGKVDCDNENPIATQYHITKYPTIKIFRSGNVVKKEYRGQRAPDAIGTFIREQLKDPIIVHESMEKLDEIDMKKRHMIGYFEDKETDNFKTYRRVASQLREDCTFHAAFGSVSEPERTGGDNVVFRPPNTHRQDIVYQGPINNPETMLVWATDKCVPLVREITFDNAEELTEEGLPFLILFHHPDDIATVETFNTEVVKQLLGDKNSVNFLTADGLKFSHPLHHLGKSSSDLPILAIDSFRHMYIFKHDVKTDLTKPGLLKQFVDDLHSGKLHREFHHGPDPETPPPPSADQNNEEEKHIPHDPIEKPDEPTSPPESSFVKLAPSHNRYTLVPRDEL
ncbi:hypothetical protein ACJMK2_014859 [Sinanodonta woodiana]|uniref:Thioredoxin domain-containing protein n=1 Tax=Sinanodonta woodiana TaxID=1069815 RepID=A0ABD3V531_SINWO